MNEERITESPSRSDPRGQVMKAPMLRLRACGWGPNLPILFRDEPPVGSQIPNSRTEISLPQLRRLRQAALLILKVYMIFFSSATLTFVPILFETSARVEDSC